MQVQTFYSLLERVTTEDAFTLTADWPILACDPCPSELERQMISEDSRRSSKERSDALQLKISQSLRWFTLKQARWEGSARTVHLADLGHTFKLVIRC